MTVDGDYLVFSTGRRLRAHGGVVGLTPVNGDTRISGDPSEGWDGGLEVDALTRAERRELADAMVLAWTSWGAQ